MVNTMGLRTKFSIATPCKESLRKTVPVSILKYYKLKAGDMIERDFEARNNEMIIVVKPVKSEKGA